MFIEGLQQTLVLIIRMNIPFKLSHSLLSMHAYSLSLLMILQVGPDAKQCRCRMMAYSVYLQECCLRLDCALGQL